MRSIWEMHVERWGRGCGSDLCPHPDRPGGAQSVCLARGSLPCDILFVGEAPGMSEDMLGQPFSGPAGHLLDEIVNRAVGDFGLRVAFTNIVGCVPIGEDGQKTAQPPHEAIESCSARLVDLVQLARPRLVVAVGKMAEDYLTPGYAWSIDIGPNIARVAIMHPAAILRSNTAQQGLQIQRARVVLRNAVMDVFKDAKEG